MLLTVFAFLHMLLSSLVLVLAQAPSDLPDCALGCARAAANKVNCALTDAPCLCKTTFVSAVIQCAAGTSCSAAEKSEVGTLLSAMCASSSGSVSGSRSASPSGAPSSAGGAPSSSVPLTLTTITSTFSSPPRTTTFTTSVPISASVVSSATAPSSSVPAPSTTTSTGAADISVVDTKLAGIAAAMLGIGLLAL
ncbi:hypothetical protein C8J57DRAFT_1393533 [Mycena rebaudengoi]|nr:hypothetical protein C8J57DRAFT_1393533 [Mycena rebaudengoi]